MELSLGSSRFREALELDCSVSDKVTGFGQYLKAVGQVDKMVKGLNQDEGLGSFTNYDGEPLTFRKKFCLLRQVHSTPSWPRASFLPFSQVQDYSCVPPCPI